MFADGADRPIAVFSFCHFCYLLIMNGFDRNHSEQPTMYIRNDKKEILQNNKKTHQISILY
jgi:hypothetical protein